jgi:hypothetical protein
LFEAHVRVLPGKCVALVGREGGRLPYGHVQRGVGDELDRGVCVLKWEGGGGETRVDT